MRNDKISSILYFCSSILYFYRSILYFHSSIRPVLEKYETALLLLLGFAGVSIILALLHRLVRKHVYHDANNVDTAFDAGGRVSTSLTAVTVASQFLWPGDILQSSTITVKVGNI